MLDRGGELVYVGKAKSLRARLLSYFRRRSRDPKAGRILSRTRTLVWEPAANEFAALLRELELIQRWRPRFNVFGQPRHGRLAFVCLGRAPAPYLFLTRQIPRQCVAVCGPVRSCRAIQEAIRFLNDFFRLRDCPCRVPMVFANAKALFSEPLTPGCLRLDVGTCTGPCAAACSEQDYGRQVRAATGFLNGVNSHVIEHLEQAMATAANEQAFERAAGLRDRLQAILHLQAAVDRVRQAQELPPRMYECGVAPRDFVWHLLQRGRVAATFARPQTAAEHETTMRRACGLLCSMLRHSPVAAEELDEVLLVAAWFRKHPEELERVWEVV
jgi:excinuclease ABC subunit C